MLDNLWGFPVSWYYIVGIIIGVFAVMLLLRMVNKCVLEDGEKKCKRSLIQLGVFGIFTIIYMVFLLFVSLFVVIYAMQYGWSSVYTLDLIFAVGYLFILVLIFRL
jgi:hypothetical protein